MKDSEVSRKEMLYKFLNNSSSSATKKMIPENSDYGFVQYLFFAEMGEQFALKWHAGYNEKYVICSSKDMREVIDNYSVNDFFSADSESLEKLKECSPEIVVETGDNYYNISWIENRTHSGIFKCTYKIDKLYPHKIEKIKEDELVEITINFLY